MEEAQRLIVMTCPTDMAGQHYARELAEDQTLENLGKFSDRLERAYNQIQPIGGNDVG